MSRFTELPPVPGTRFSSVRLVPETGSTNADLLAEGVAGAAEGQVLVTDHQRAGRGRQSRVWHDEPGNALLVSVLLRPPRELAPLIPLVTGLGAVEAVCRVVGQPAGHHVGGRPGRPVGLKWPNDVLAPGHDERKLAGILAESTTVPAGPGGVGGATSAGDRPIVVVGMGLNLRWGTPPPPDIAARAVTLDEVAGREVARQEILTPFLQALDRWLGRLEADGPGPVLDAYRAACLTLGRQVRFASANGEHRGNAVAVSGTGTLVLRTEDGREVELDAGDAHHLGPAPSRTT